MDEETVSYSRKDIIEILADLNIIVVSLDRIGSSYSELNSDEKYNAVSSEFLTDWKVFQRLAQARKILSEAFSSELGDDDMDELEREFQNLEYWSLQSSKPSKKRKTKS